MPYAGKVCLHLTPVAPLLAALPAHCSRACSCRVTPMMPRSCAPHLHSLNCNAYPHLCAPCTRLSLQGDAYDAFISVAQKSEDAVFVETTKKDVAKAAGLSSAGVAVITNFEGECRVEDGW